MNRLNKMNTAPILSAHNRKMPVTHPLVMGILNITPDSFFVGSRYTAVTEVLKAAENMINQGVHIIDIGGQSSRPGADTISALDEWDRIEEIITSLRKHFPQLWLSVDTFYAEVAHRSVELGIDIINDISFGKDDTMMFEELKNKDITYIGMHKRGNSKNMQTLTEYQNIVLEISQYLKNRRLEAYNSGLQNVWVDPGFGFSKTLAQNYELLAQLEFLCQEIPDVMIGVSRKSMVYKLLDCDPSESLNGSTFLHAVGLMKGAKILRVHDVAEAIQCIKIHNQLIA